MGDTDINLKIKHIKEVETKFLSQINSSDIDSVEKTELWIAYRKLKKVRMDLELVAFINKLD